MEYTDEMFNEDLSISRYVYSKYFRYSFISKDDFIQCSLIGLSRCRSKFNETKGAYSTYASKISLCCMLRLYNEEKKQTNNFSNFSCDLKNDEGNSLFDIVEDKFNIDAKLDYDFLLKICNNILSKSKSDTFKKVNYLFLQYLNCSKVARELKISKQCVNQYVKKFRTQLRAELENLNF